VDSLFGAHSGYGNLRNALARYRSIYAQGGWGTVASARDRAGIARRLRATGDLGADSTDAGFGAAVQRFKQRHGLDSTATVNRATLDAMNVPVEQRIAQIEVNLERIRWMPADRGDTYLRVNIPTYGLEVYENGQRTMAMDVIVGDEANNTPVFSDTMTTVVFAPYWNVPKSIQEEELLPKGEAYLARNNFEFEGPTGLRQKPGNDNALGHVKFLFPNDMNIYLHDTPGRAAFNRDNRSLSHGCIRVSRPADLAVWVLGPNGDWDRGKIEAAMAGTEEQHIPLKRDIPVFIEYLTAWADDDGTVHFRKDIYGHDAKLATEIARTRRQTAGATCTRRLETAPAAPARDSAAVPAVALHRLRSRLRV
jgi:L,D-transpeptidase YcbB